MERINTAYLSLGSNIEDRYDYLVQACKKLTEFGIIEEISPIYETSPLGFKAESNFLNLVLKFKSEESAPDLLKAINSIENQLGRVRKQSKEYTSRVIDLDIICFNDEIINTEKLSIPHPRYTNRNFVLIPLSDIAPDLFDPILKISIKELLNLSTDQSKVFLSKKRIKPKELI